MKLIITVLNVDCAHGNGSKLAMYTFEQRVESRKGAKTTIAVNFPS